MKTDSLSEGGEGEGESSEGERQRKYAVWRGNREDPCDGRDVKELLASSVKVTSYILYLLMLLIRHIKGQACRSHVVASLRI